MSIFVQMAFWGDERSVVTALGFWAFHHIYYHPKKRESMKTLFVIIGNVFLYICIRAYLSTNFHLAAEDVENSTFDRYIYFIKFTSLWYSKRSYVAVEGFSLFIMLVFSIFYIDKKYSKIFLSLIYWLPIVAISFLVGDTVRTFSFTFVFWLIALIIIKERIEKPQLKLLLIILTFINILIPVIFP